MDYWTIKVNNQDLRSTYEEALEESIHQSSQFFVISQRMKTRLIKKHKLDPDSVTVAHNYIPVSQLVLDSNPSQQQSHFSILYSGNLDPDQSIDPLIDICNAIKLLNSEQSETYRLKISTSDYHREINGHHFKEFNFVELQSQINEHDLYIRSLAEADLCIIAYGYSIESRQYLLDSMANKLPDLVSARAKFLGYGDPEIGTLNYLSYCQYPFVETSRNLKQLAKRIKQLVSMSYNEYSEICASSLSEIRNEFSEMAQCHVFQHHISACTLNVSAEPKNTYNYTKLIDLYSKILSKSGENMPQGISDELSLMKYLISHRDLLGPVNTLVRSHGLTWSVNKTRTYIEKNINKITDDNDLIVQSLAWMITSQRHSRFSVLWSKLFDLIIASSH
jgi:glycosyltransferase involved in cell wall biosynthesis